MRLIAAIALSALSAGPATAFIAQNGLVVEPEGGTAFHIPWRGKSSPADFWCAAGDYAVRVLHVRPGTTIYRASEPPRRSGEGIRFTLDPARAASSTGLVVYGTQGAGIAVGHAQAFCEKRRDGRSR
ncbi:hypothetical protein DEA8626_02222 [Defluviimonas aquaemixtae]|uniref:Uncharacterized protein n=1 Tax=Albidovulum aquaemixtae TaxID=1542388 RepID=A0A2R8B7U4_9RHOB|nr:hypothetical protein [Defluviimonas aquaemixtae]SPH18680.1 hypothetical protein DEA8626_02222 [Defluviimonas aquaemixtae]